MSPPKPRKKQLIRRSPPPPPPPPTGLANLGNSCYLNAVVQALAHCGPFAKCLCDLVGDPRAADDGSADAETRLARALTGCLGALLPRPPPAGRSSSAAVRPAALLSAIQARTPAFGGYRQQDAHELLRSLLDGLHQHLQQRHELPPQPGRQEAPERMVIDECTLVDEAARSALVPASPSSDTAAAVDAAAAPDDAAEPVIVSLDSEATGIELLAAPAAAAAGADEASRPDSSASRPTTGPSRPGTAAPLPTRQPVTSVVQDMFEGALVSTVRCLRCGRTSHVLEPCMDLSLPLPDEAATPDASLRACLDSYFAPEELCGGEQYACERCRSKQDCSKSLRLLHPPQLLVVHLLRFRGGHGGGPAKCSERLPFDVDALDLSPYVCEGVGDGARPATYDLCALIEHHGATATSGHYTACVRRDGGGGGSGGGVARAARWYQADDGRVQPIDEATVAQSQAYLLFFERRQPGAGGAGEGDSPRPQLQPQPQPQPQPQQASPAASATSSPCDAAWGAAWAAADPLADGRAGAPRQRPLQQLRARWRNSHSPAPRPLTPPSTARPAADGSSSVAALARRGRRLRFAKRHASPSPVLPAVELCVSDDDSACTSLLARPESMPLETRPVSADGSPRAPAPAALASHASHASHADATPPSSAAVASQHARAARWRSVRATRPRSASPNCQRRHGARQTRETRDAWMVYQTPRLGLRRPWHKHTKIHTWPLAEPSPSPTKSKNSKTRISLSQTR